MLSIARSHWISSGSCCKTDIMWAKLFLPSRLNVQSISLKIKKCPGFKCQSSILVSCSVKILFFWLWKSIWRAFSTRTIASSTIWFSVCSNPITKENHFQSLFTKYVMKSNTLSKQTFWSKDLYIYYLLHFPLLQIIFSCLRLMRTNPVHLFFR